MAPMRIAFVIYGSLETVSGGFIYDKHLVTALRALGHEVDVIALPWRGYVHALLRGALAAQSRRDNAPRPFDAVIEDELVHPSVARQHPGRPIDPCGKVRVALVHNLRSRQPGERFRALKVNVERRYLTGLDGVIAVCGSTLEDVRTLTGGSPPAIVAHAGRDHIDPAVDDHMVEARSIESGPLRILHAAAVEPHKGLHRLLDVLAKATQTAHRLAFTLDVVGHLGCMPYLRSIRRQVTRLGLDARVTFHGQLAGPALWDTFRRSHVMALPSDREAYSLACLEALGFGLPVLGTAAGGLGEMISDGIEGHLLAPDDLDAWRDALVRLASNRSELATMGRAACARYRRHTTWSEVALIVQDFLRTRLQAEPHATAP